LVHDASFRVASTDSTEICGKLIGPARTRSPNFEARPNDPRGWTPKEVLPVTSFIETSVIDDSTSRASSRDRPVLRAPGGPVDLDRHSAGGDRLRSDELERYVGAGVGEQPRALADDQGEGEQVDLVDEMTLFSFPVVVGRGTRLFPEAGPDMALELVGSRATPSGVTIQVYRPAGRPQYGTAAPSSNDVAD
jgi:hypothetical protein